ncbi:MAG: ribonuclease P protein component [Lachnospiraceae bacterium]|nr:ribonuclease P protein component [Lachnospiraceae bacterium]
MKKNTDFSRVYHCGTSKADRNLVVYASESVNHNGLFGISVSKKVGNSVVRHKIKRRLKEIRRLNNDFFSDDYDIVVIARNRAAEADYERLSRSLLRLTESVTNPSSEYQQSR